MALDKHDASQNSCSHSTQEHCGISSVGADDESEWLHRNDRSEERRVGKECLL